MPALGRGLGAGTDIVLGKGRQGQHRASPPSLGTPGLHLGRRGLPHKREGHLPKVTQLWGQGPNAGSCVVLFGSL